MQQQQAEVQSRLDLMNEKMENWVVQCFSDLRARIIELVRPPTSLLGCASAVPPLHGRPLSRLLGCAFAVPPLHSRPLSILLACAFAVPPLHGRPLSRLLGCASAVPALLGRPLSKLLGRHHQIVGCYIFIVIIAVSLTLLQYLEPPPAVMQGYTSGQLNGV